MDHVPAKTEVTGILASKEQNIISDPGKGDNLPRYVANESVNAPSYVVCKKRSARHGAYYVCSASCIDFKAYDICAHTLAVAEMDSSRCNEPVAMANKYRINDFY